MYNINFQEEATALANKLSIIHGRAYLATIGVAGIDAFAYKILLGPFTEKKEAKEFIQKNRKGIPNDSWIRQVKAFDELYVFQE